MDMNVYNTSDRLGYLANMLNVRTKGKAYENFIVNAIYTKVNNKNLVPVTQQYVKNPKDKRKYYLLDLYFPQLNYGIEIDERHHLAEHNRVSDIEREEAVKSAIECEEDRIPIFNQDGSPRTFEEVSKDIDRVVENIKCRITENGPLIWETNEDLKSKAIKRGRFVVSDNIYYESITEIYNICGGKRTGPHKGEKADSLQKCYYRLNDKFKLWVPPLAIRNSDGTYSDSKKGYRNLLSEDYTILTEIAKEPWKHPNKDIQYNRVVFMRMRDRFGKPCIKFIGVFKQIKSDESNCNSREYERIAEEVCIDNLKISN